jgi:hypothetical protein
MSMKQTPLPHHESYGMVALSRVQGQMNLHGSPIRPGHFMMLRIHECSPSSHHNLGTDWRFEGACVAEIAMSEMQFAEMITTPNLGSGVPCTLRYARNGEGLHHYEEPPRQHTEASRTRDEFRSEVEERMATMKAVKRRIDTLMEEGSLAKARRMEIGGEIDRLLQLFTSSAPFFMERFEENAEKVVTTAKAEITAHAEMVARHVGIAALKEQEMPLLIASVRAETDPKAQAPQ